MQGVVSKLPAASTWLELSAAETVLCALMAVPACYAGPYTGLLKINHI